VRVFDGAVRTEIKSSSMASESIYEVEEVGYLTPKPVKQTVYLRRVGYLMRESRISDARIGDTITEKNRRTAKALPGFKEAKPWFFGECFHPGEPALKFEDALEKLQA